MSISKYFAPIKKISSTINPPDKRQSDPSPPPAKELKSSSKFFQNDSDSSSGTIILEDPPEAPTVKKSTQPSLILSSSSTVPSQLQSQPRPVQVKKPTKPVQEPAKPTKPIQEPPSIRSAANPPSLPNPKNPSKSSKPRKQNTKEVSERPGIEGKTFVITGVLHDFSREGLSDRIKQLGGKVTGNVSKNTTYLVHGLKLEDGRVYTEGNKYKKAKELGTKILDEEGFLKLIEGISESDKVNEEENKEQVQIKPKSKAEKFNASVAQISDLWTEKYKPLKSVDIIGNSSALDKLQAWLENWENNCLIGDKSKGKVKSTEHTNAKAAIISGPPGIGKTTAARLLALENGFKVMEMNASDIRSKKLIQETVLGSSLSHCLTMQGDVVRNLIIMDEVDGMSAGDRGGVAALIKVIESSRNPIICICNDRQSPKLKSLLNHCYDIRFSKPNKLQITRRVLQILRQEQINVEPNAVEFLVESSGNDIRQILTNFDMWSRSYSEMTYMQAKRTFSSGNKDTTCMVSNFEAALKLFNSSEMRRLSHKERIDLAYIDYDLIPLIVHENYLDALDKNNLERLSQAADSIVLADLMNREIYGNGNWSLLPAYLQESCIHPTMLCKNLLSFARFPEFYGRSSTLRKNQRLALELQVKSGNVTGGASLDIVNEFVPVVFLMIVELLKKNEFDTAAQSLYELGLDPETFKENIVGLYSDDKDYKDLSLSSKKNMTIFFNKNFSNCLQRVKGKKKESQQKDKFDPEFQDLSEIELDDDENESILEELEAKPTILKKKR